MPKIIYSTYHFSSLSSFNRIKEFNGILLFVMFTSLAYSLLFGLIIFGKIIFKSISILLSDAEKIQTLLAFYNTEATNVCMVLSFLAVSPSIYILYLLFSLHFILTTKNLYLFSPLFPFIIQKIALEDIAFVRMRAIETFKDDYQRTLIIHLKNNEQKPYSLPWTDAMILKEKLENLGITTVIYTFYPKMFV